MEAGRECRVQTCRRVQPGAGACSLPSPRTPVKERVRAECMDGD